MSLMQTSRKSTFMKRGYNTPEGDTYNTRTYTPAPVERRLLDELSISEDESEVDEQEVIYQNSKIKQEDSETELQSSNTNNTQSWSNNWNRRSNRGVSTRLYQFIARNAFMSINILWLLAPLGCFVLALVIPHYFTTAIRYADILATGFGRNYPLNDQMQFDPTSVRTMIQEAVDSNVAKLSEDVSGLRKYVESQALDLEAIKIMQERLTILHNEYQEGVLSMHVKEVITSTVAKTWETQHQSMVKKWEEAIEQLSNTKTTESTNGGYSMELINDLKNRMQSMESDLGLWKENFQTELYARLQEKFSGLEQKISHLLSYYSSVTKDLNNFDHNNPALTSVIRNVVHDISRENIGTIDHAALANGGSVVYSKDDMLQDKTLSLSRIFSYWMLRDNHEFTSSPFRRSSIFNLSWLWSSSPWWLSRSNMLAETALSETMELGSCWGLAGSNGKLSVKFAHPIRINAIAIDHIPAQIAMDFSSAPQKFALEGLQVDKSTLSIKRLSLGNFTYDHEGGHQQYFSVSAPMGSKNKFDGVTLVIQSNYGNPDYTCLYRLKVHGDRS